LGGVVVTASNVYELIGVATTSALGSVTIAENARPTFDGVFAIGVVGIVGITAIVFDYNAVAALYDRRRTVSVDRRSSSSDRTLVVAAQDRTVYVDRVSTPSTRSIHVSSEDRKVYTYRKPSSSDRSAMVA
jgi:hypothetical protein